MKGNKLVIAVILALIVCLVLIPTCAFADENLAATGEVISDNGAGNTASGDNLTDGQSEGGVNPTVEETKVDEPKVEETEENNVVEDGASSEENVPLQPSEPKYTVEFTAGEKQYFLDGDTSVGLDDILGELGISGTVTEASSSNDSLFSVAMDENGKWTVSANNAFSTTHSLTVVVDGQTYEIVVTDANVCVVKNGSTEAEYGTLQGAIDAANNGDTIVLKDNVTESVNIAAGKTITIDLNGKTLTNEDGKHTIWNNGTLTIIDSVGTGVVDSVYNGKAALVNNGTATITGGTITRSKETGVDFYTSGGNSYYVIDNHGSMTIEGDTKVEANGWFSSLIRNVGTASANAELTINDGSFYNGANNVKNDDYGILVIKGGTFVNEKYVTIMNWNVATINGGTFNSEAYNTVTNGYWESNGTVPGAGELTINGGTFNSASESSGNLFGEGVGAKKGEGTITINGGNFNGTANSNDMSYDVIYNNGVFTDSNVKDLVDKADVVVISANGKTAVANNKDAASIAAIIDEAVKSGEPLVIENLPKDVSVSAPEGVTIINKSGSTLTVNGVEVKPGESYTVPTTAAPAFAPLSAKYFVLEGKAQQWTDGDLEFVLNSNAVVKVLIDGVEVEFTVAEDSTVTIASTVIEALDAGTHEIEFVFADGSCTTTFTK